MARIGRGNTFDFVAKFFYACSILSLCLVLIVLLQNVVIPYNATDEQMKRWAFVFLMCSLGLASIGVLFQGLADIVFHLMQISQNTRETARKLQEMSVPRDSEQPPLP